MLDGMRFDPAEVTVKSGEVVTFHLVNTDQVAHEFTLGDSNAQELHDAQMAQMDMSGDATGMAMPDHSTGMKMPHDPAHQKYMKRLAEQVTALDKVAAANISVHVLPRETKDVTWAFTGDKTPVFACHVPGHWKAGMQGSIVRV
jgi:uncharacterized cupredoxin-like copper-binding protein